MLSPRRGVRVGFLQQQDRHKRQRADVCTHSVALIACKSATGLRDQQDLYHTAHEFDMKPRREPANRLNDGNVFSAHDHQLGRLRTCVCIKEQEAFK